MSQGLRCRGEFRGLPRTLLPTRKLFRGKPSSFGLDQNTIVIEVLDKLANAFERTRTMPGAVDKVIEKCVSDDVEGGVEKQFLLQYVPRTLLHGALDVDAREKRVENAGVPHEQDGGPW